MVWLWAIVALLILGAAAGGMWRRFAIRRAPARLTAILATLLVVFTVAAYVVARILGPGPDCVEGPCGGYGVVVLMEGFVVAAVLAAATAIAGLWWLADRLFRERRREP